MSGTAIFWFRRDLRLRDNPGLRAALDRSETVVPVYIDDSASTGTSSPGAASRAWLHRSLRELDASLAARGSRLSLYRGDALDLLPGLVEATGAQRVFWNRLYEPATIRRDKALRTKLVESGVEVSTHNASLLLEPWKIETGTGGPYRVFTPFWTKAVRAIDPGPSGTPRQLRPPERWPQSLSLDDLNLAPAPGWDKGFWSRWTPGESGAQKLLRRWLRGGIVGYTKRRDVPAIDGVSRLSAHLHFGEISPCQVWEQVSAMEASAPGDSAAYLRQLGWREFAHHVLYHFPETPERALNVKFRDFAWRQGFEPLLERWKDGQTGIPIVDAGMRELWQTGWMHNRVRMIVASFLTKNIRAPWQEGAAWFHDTLVDADLANNTLGWQWVAGCGADAAPYFRIFNPVRQGEKFDKQGRYVRRYVPNSSGCRTGTSTRRGRFPMPLPARSDSNRAATTRPLYSTSRNRATRRSPH